MADPALLANLYISSAATTFTIIALIVGYAFTVADRARAEADALLANILPEAIAERLKARPNDKVADSVGEASVLFTDLVGFTELAARLGVKRTVALLDHIVTEFDRLAAAHEVEKIKTIGDGYMAVAGVSRRAAGSSGAACPYGAAACPVLSIGSRPRTASISRSGRDLPPVRSWPASSAATSSPMTSGARP